MKLKCRCGQVFETEGARPGSVIQASCCGRKVKVPQKRSSPKRKRRNSASRRATSDVVEDDLFSEALAQRKAQKKRKKSKPKSGRPIFHIGFMRGDWVRAQHLLAGAVVVGVLGFGIGLAGFMKARSERAKAAVSLAWEKTTGTIVDSSYRTETRRASGCGAAFRDPVVIAFPTASYHYDVNGQQMRGGNIWPKPLERTVAQAEALMTEYSKGKQVDVYYNPANPSQSVLQPGVVDRRWANDIIAYIILGATFVFVLDCLIGFYNHTQRRPFYR